MRVGWPAGALILWLAALPARAQPAREVAVALLWRSSDGCLDTGGLYRAVRSRRRPVGSATDADAIISGRAEVRPGGGWHVELVAADRRGAILGRRSLEVAEDGCAPLREHVALVVAMLVDSSVVEGAADIQRAPPPSDVRSDEGWQGDADTVLLGEIGRLPGEEPGLGAAFGLTLPGRWRGEVGLAVFAQSTARDDSGETTLRWIAGHAAACRARRGIWRRRPTWLREVACVGLEAGVMSAKGAGFTRNQRDHELLVDAVVSSRLEIDLVGPTFLLGGFGWRLAARRPRFGYEDETGVFQPLYQPSLIGLVVEIGVGAHFP